MYFNTFIFNSVYEGASSVAIEGSMAPTTAVSRMVALSAIAAVKDFIPEGKAGLFRGVRMIFTVLIPMVVGPVLGDVACRNAANFEGDIIVPSKEMFFVAAIVCSTVLIPLFILMYLGFDAQEKKNISEVK